MASVITEVAAKILRMTVPNSAACFFLYGLICFGLCTNCCGRTICSTNTRILAVEDGPVNLTTIVPGNFYTGAVGAYMFQAHKSENKRCSLQNKLFPCSFEIVNETGYAKLEIPNVAGVDYISLVSRTAIGDIPVTIHRTVATTSRPKKPYFIIDGSETFDKCSKTSEANLTWTVFGADDEDQDQFECFVNGVRRCKQISTVPNENSKCVVVFDGDTFTHTYVAEKPKNHSLSFHHCFVKDQLMKSLTFLIDWSGEENEEPPPKEPNSSPKRGKALLVIGALFFSIISTGNI